MARLKQVRDEPNASGNGKMTEVLALLYYLGGDARQQEQANRTLFAVGGTVDDEALEGFQLLCRTEGIIPALETAHAIHYASKLAPTLGKDETVLVCLSGRGDKDMDTVIDALGLR